MTTEEIVTRGYISLHCRFLRFMNLLDDKLATQEDINSCVPVL